jgi:cytochrome c biogenesis protein ResB
MELRYILRPPTVKAFESHVTVLDEAGKEVQKSVILVNSPLKVGRYTFYQVSYDPETMASSTLEVTSDPGVPLVFAGFILLPIGIALAIYARPSLTRRGRSDV